MQIAEAFLTNHFQFQSSPAWFFRRGLLLFCFESHYKSNRYPIILSQIFWESQKMLCIHFACSMVMKTIMGRPLVLGKKFYCYPQNPLFHFNALPLPYLSPRLRFPFQNMVNYQQTFDLFTESLFYSWPFHESEEYFNRNGSIPVRCPCIEFSCNGSWKWTGRRKSIGKYICDYKQASSI